MLELATRRRRLDTDGSEDGIALVAVLIVMLVGFVIVTTITASVLFTFVANNRNGKTTQAFIAAESGRDAMLASLMATPCNLSIANSANPAFQNVSAKVGPDKDHLTDSCLGATSSTIQITSTGVSSAGNTTVVSIYQRLATISNQPGGSLSYFAGSFKWTQSVYKGDIVIRDGTYECNSASTIDGDLWVPHGGVILSAKCDVTGSIYARDGISITAAQEQIGTVGKAGTGDVVSQTGPITFESSNGVITGNVLSGGAITVKNGTINGNASAGGATGIITTQAQGMILGTKSEHVVPSPAVFNPSLDDVYTMTNWLDLAQDRSLWGSDVHWVTVPNTTADCTGDQKSALSAALTGSETRYGFDYSACTSNVTVTISAGNFTRDAVFLVPAAVNMHVNITGSISSVGAPKTPQFFFIHADLNPTVTGPGCHTGYDPSDGLDLPNNGTVAPDIMVYSPCGMDAQSVPKNNQSFSGQYYSADTTPLDKITHWVQPTFNCKPMSWTPLIKLGCYIKDAGTGDNGTIETTIQPPTLISQIENPQ